MEVLEISISVHMPIPTCLLCIIIKSFIVVKVKLFSYLLNLTTGFYPLYMMYIVEMEANSNPLFVSMHEIFL